MIYPLLKKNQGQSIVRLNTVILTKVKVQSIDYVALPTRASNKFRGDTIRLGAVYVCDDANNEILEKIFSRKELNHNDFIL